MLEIDSKLAKQIIAKRVAKEMKDGQLVNLGIGLPTLVPNYISDDIHITFQSENGMAGMGPTPKEGEENINSTNAGGAFVTILPHGAYFDSVVSFGLIRGGHVDTTVLGALEVASNGDIANWIVPNKMVAGMGGAMDLLTGAKNVIVAMQHTAKGQPKILENCTLPLTARNAVNLIVTEYCVMEVREDGLFVTEKHPDVTIEEIQSVTGAKLNYDSSLKNMEI